MNLVLMKTRKAIARQLHAFVGLFPDVPTTNRFDLFIALAKFAIDFTFSLLPLHSAAALMIEEAVLFYLCEWRNGQSSLLEETSLRIFVGLQRGHGLLVLSTHYDISLDRTAKCQVLRRWILMD